MNVEMYSLKAFVRKKHGKWIVEFMGFRFEPSVSANTWARAIFLAARLPKLITDDFFQLQRGQRLRVMGFDGTVPDWI